MHTNRKLFDLATKNSQKIAIGDFMRGLPESLGALLSASQRIFHPEISELLAVTMSKAARLEDGQVRPEPDINVIKTASKEKATVLVNTWIDVLPEGQYVLVVGGGNGVRFNDETFWVSRLPGHYVALPCHGYQVKEIISSDNGECVLAGINTMAAIIVDSVGGYLPEEPSEQEIVFELSSWGLNG